MLLSLCHVFFCWMNWPHWIHECNSCIQRFNMRPKFILIVYIIIAWWCIYLCSQLRFCKSFFMRICCFMTRFRKPDNVSKMLYIAFKTSKPCRPFCIRKELILNIGWVVAVLHLVHSTKPTTSFFSQTSCCQWNISIEKMRK